MTALLAKVVHIVLIALVVFDKFGSTCNSGYYTAAVLEMQALRGNQISKLTARALTVVRQQAERARQNGVQLLVLPEYALIPTQLLFAPQARTALASYAQQLPQLSEQQSQHRRARGSRCRGKRLLHRQQTDRAENTNATALLRELSAIASANNLYLVANLIERVPCNSTHNPQCPAADQQLLYNTNVVFDRHGTMIQHYRKYHLFGVEQKVLNRETEPHQATFKTDFGVTFGMFTCFDILFQSPAAVMATDGGVRHFAFPTAWMDQLPSLSALQTHSGWARGLGVTLLSANIRQLKIGGVGSGIYGPQGSINYTFNIGDQYKNTLVIGRVPIQPQRDGHTRNVNENKLIDEPDTSGSITNATYEAIGDRYTPKHYNTSEFVTRTLKVPGPKQTLCHQNVCCIFEPLDEESHTHYNTSRAKLTVFDGHRGYPPRFSTKICAIESDTTESESRSDTAEYDNDPAHLYEGVQLPPFRLCATFTVETIVLPSVQIGTLRLATEPWSYTEYRTQDNTHFNRPTLQPQAEQMRSGDLQQPATTPLNITVMEGFVADDSTSQATEKIFISSRWKSMKTSIVETVMLTDVQETVSTSGKSEPDSRTFAEPSKWACMTIERPIANVLTVQMYGRDPTIDKP